MTASGGVGPFSFLPPTATAFRCAYLTQKTERAKSLYPRHQDKMTTMTDRLRKINDHRQSLIKCLAPSASDYGFGGAHRCWVKECAVLTADAYIARATAFTEQMGGEMPIVLMTHIAIPMPSAWGGVRPAECSEYGHPHLASKDWRHFENTLRWRFADKGWLTTECSLNDYKEIVFVADKMINVAKMPFAKIKEEDFKDKPPTQDAVLPELPYDEWCDKLDKEMEGSKIAEQRAALEHLPYALRPIVAMGMCGGATAGDCGDEVVGDPQ